MSRVRVSEARIVYAVVDVGVDGDEALVWFQAAIVVAEYVVCNIVRREMNRSNESEENG